MIVMRAKQPLWKTVILINILILTACGGGNSQSDNVGDVKLSAVPAEFKDMNNPLNGDPIAIDVGKETYFYNCASCHGDTGRGDGTLSGSLDTGAGNLAGAQRDRSDGYLYWRIADGGILEPFNSAMPSWKGVLSEAQIWELVSFLCTFEE